MAERRCSIELRPDQERYVPHVMVQRKDGTWRCATCHPTREELLRG